jgi:hypothetical protein
MTLLRYKKNAFSNKHGYGGIYCHQVAKAGTMNWARVVTVRRARRDGL